MSLFLFLCNNLRKSNILSINSLFITKNLTSSQAYLQIHRSNSFICLIDASANRAIHLSSFNPKIFGTFNPIKVFDIWYALEKLKNEWDPHFSLSSFKQGAAKALFTIVELVKENKWEDLRGLISRPFLERLQQDTQMLEKICQIKLEEDLLTTDITKVSLQEIVDRKYCDIEVTFTMKERENKRVTFRYIIKFHREYTEGKLPEWTITKIIVVKENTKILGDI